MTYIQQIGLEPRNLFTNKTKKQTFLMSLKHSLLKKLTATGDKASKGRQHFFLPISFPPDIITTCTCNFCQAKMLKGHSKRFYHFSRIPYKGLQ